MGIGDFILIGGVALFALIGIWRGGAKIFFGLFLLLVIMVGASFLSGWICPNLLRKETDGNVEYTKTATVLMDPIADKLPLSDEIFNDPVEQDADGTYYVGEKTAEEAFNNIPAVGSFLYPIFKPFLVPGQSIRTVIAYKITEYIYEFIVWLILVIILVIVRNILRKRIYVFLDKHSLSSKIDRLIGAIVMVVIFMGIYWGAGAIFTRIAGSASWASSVASILTEGTLVGPITAINPFLKLFG